MFNSSLLASSTTIRVNLLSEFSSCNLSSRADLGTDVIVALRGRRPENHQRDEDAMRTLSPQPADSGARPRERVLVLHEDTAAREHAAHFCSRLSERCGGEVEVIWTSFRSLANDAKARDAMQHAVEVDFIVFAASGPGEMPEHVKRWTESALSIRSEHEGAIVGLFEHHADCARMAPDKEVYLRNLAHRAGLDYLSQPSPTTRRAIPDSLDSYSERALQVTSVLDEILQTRPAPVPPL